MTAQSVNPFWLDEPDLWDEVQLGGDKMPGLFRLEASTSIGRKIDLRKPSGSDGGRIIDKGYDLAKVNFSLLMWLPEQFSSWETLLPKLLPRQKLSERQPLEIVHPAVNELGITAVYVVKIGVLVPGDVWGTRTSAIECIEFNPPSTTTRSRTRRPDLVIGEDEAAQQQEAQNRQMQGIADVGTLFSGLNLSPSDDSKAQAP